MYLVQYDINVVHITTSLLYNRSLHVLSKRRRLHFSKKKGHMIRQIPLNVSEKKMLMSTYRVDTKTSIAVTQRMLAAVSKYNNFPKCFKII